MQVRGRNKWSQKIRNELIQTVIKRRTKTNQYLNTIKTHFYYSLSRPQAHSAAGKF